MLVCGRPRRSAPRRRCCRPAKSVRSFLVLTGHPATAIAILAEPGSQKAELVAPGSATQCEDSRRRRSCRQALPVFAVLQRAVALEAAVGRRLGYDLRHA